MEQRDFIQTHPLLSSFVILFGNLIPLYGVLFWGWELFDIFYIYWAENILIGFAVITRMFLVSAAWGIFVFLGTLFHIAFFTVHYGMFCFGHGMIMFDIFYKGAIDINENSAFLLGYILGREQEFILAIFGLLCVVVLKTMHDVFEDRRDARLPQTIMFSPYGRIIILHLTILLGGLLAEKLGTPIWALVFLIVLKTSYDLMSARGVNIFKKEKR